MRIISGTCKGRRLTPLTGGDVRPTPDRAREALFSSLNSRLGGFTDIQVLDLYAGTGAMALEALSRGAEKAVLVDKGHQASAVIRENIELCRFPDKAHFVHAEVLKSLPSLASQGPFQIIFVDPPYGKGMVPTTLEMVSRLSLLDSDGILCAETARKEILPDRIGELELLDQRHYGSTTISFFTLHPTESNGE